MSMSMAWVNSAGSDNWLRLGKYTYQNSIKVEEIHPSVLAATTGFALSPQPGGKGLKVAELPS
jgi:hypothetical protein